MAVKVSSIPPRTPRLPNAGDVIAGKYRLERLLKQGGMGAVWIATHLGLDERVAVKFMDPRRVSSMDARVRFTREAKAAAQIRSKNIVQILDHGVDNNVPYIAMELLAGEDLAARLRRVGRLSVVEASALLGDIAHALDRAHAAGIVHRDLKPENIFLAKDGDHEIPKILDFGIALEVQADASDDSAATQEGVILGTPYFMSPEQVRGRANVDHRSDLWSVGVILFRAITGIRPFGRGAPADVIVQICSDPIPRASVVARDLPEEVDRFFEKALARDVARRFSSAKEMAAAFSAIARLASAAEKAQADAGAAGGDDRTSGSDRTADMRTAGDRTSDMRLLGDRTSETRAPGTGERTLETRRMRARAAAAAEGLGADRHGGARGSRPSASEKAGAGGDEASRTPGMAARGASEVQRDALGAAADSIETAARTPDDEDVERALAHLDEAPVSARGTSSSAAAPRVAEAVSTQAERGGVAEAGAAVVTSAAATPVPSAVATQVSATAAAVSASSAAVSASSVTVSASSATPAPASSAAVSGSSVTPAPASSAAVSGSSVTPAPASSAAVSASSVTPAPSSIVTPASVEVSGAPSSGSVVVPSAGSGERRSRGVWIAVAGAAALAGLLAFVFRERLFTPPPPPTQPSMATTIVLTAGTVVLVGPAGERIPVAAASQPSATASATSGPTPSATGATSAAPAQSAGTAEPAATGAPTAPGAGPAATSAPSASGDPAGKTAKPAATPTEVKPVAEVKPAPDPAPEPKPAASPKPTAAPPATTKTERDLGY